LEIAQGVDGLAVDAHLEVEVRAGAVSRASDVADHVALVHLLAAGDRDRALVTVGGREVAAVVDHDEVAVAGFPAAVDDRPARGGPDRGAIADADVDALVHAPPAPAERARDRAVDRPDQAGRGGSRGRASRLPVRLRRLDPRGQGCARTLQRIDL